MVFKIKFLYSQFRSLENKFTYCTAYREQTSELIHHMEEP